MSQFTITLNRESAAVLLRALSYGGSCVSQQEHVDGTADVITTNITLIERQVCQGLSRGIIEEARTKPKEET